MGQMTDVIMLGAIAIGIIYVVQNPDILSSLKIPTVEAAAAPPAEEEAPAAETEESGNGNGGGEEEGGGDKEEEKDSGDKEEEGDKKKDKKSEMALRSLAANIHVKRIKLPYDTNTIPIAKTYYTKRVNLLS